MSAHSSGGRDLAASTNQHNFLLTHQELQQKLRSSLEKTGVIDGLKAQLRAALIHKIALSSAKHGSKQLQIINQAQVPLRGRALNCLVLEYLRACDYKYTVSVFEAESSHSASNQLSRQDICKVLQLGPQSEMWLRIKQECASSDPKPNLLELFCDELRLLLSRPPASDQGTQTLNTNSGDPTDTDDLNARLKRLDDLFVAKAEALRNDPTNRDTGVAAFEERICEVQREADERASKEIKAEVARIRLTDIDTMRCELEATHRSNLADLREKYEHRHQERCTTLTKKETQLTQQLRDKESALQAANFAERQKLLVQIESLRQKELALKRESALDFRSTNVEKGRLVQQERSLEERAEAVAQAEIKFRERLDAEVEGHRLRLESELAEELQAAKSTRAKLDSEAEAIREERDEAASMRAEIEALREQVSTKHAAIDQSRKEFESESGRLEAQLEAKTAEIERLTAAVDRLQALIDDSRRASNQTFLGSQEFAQRVLELEREQFRAKESEWVQKFEALKAEMVAHIDQEDRSQTKIDEQEAEIRRLRRELDNKALFAHSQPPPAGLYSGAPVPLTQQSTSSTPASFRSEPVLLRSSHQHHPPVQQFYMPGHQLSASQQTAFLSQSNRSSVNQATWADPVRVRPTPTYASSSSIPRRPSSAPQHQFSTLDEELQQRQHFHQHEFAETQTNKQSSPELASHLSELDRELHRRLEKIQQLESQDQSVRQSLQHFRNSSEQARGLRTSHQDPAAVPTNTTAPRFQPQPQADQESRPVKAPETIVHEALSERVQSDQLRASLELLGRQRDEAEQRGEQTAHRLIQEREAITATQQNPPQQVETPQSSPESHQDQEEPVQTASPAVEVADTDRLRLVEFRDHQLPSSSSSPSPSSSEPELVQVQPETATTPERQQQQSAPLPTEDDIVQVAQDAQQRATQEEEQRLRAQQAAAEDELKRQQAQEADEAKKREQQRKRDDVEKLRLRRLENVRAADAKRKQDEAKRRQNALLKQQQEEQEEARAQKQREQDAADALKCQEEQEAADALRREQNEADALKRQQEQEAADALKREQDETDARKSQQQREADEDAERLHKEQEHKQHELQREARRAERAQERERATAEKAAAEQAAKDEAFAAERAQVKAEHEAEQQREAEARAKMFEVPEHLRNRVQDKKRPSEFMFGHNSSGEVSFDSVPSSPGELSVPSMSDVDISVAEMSDLSEV